MLISTHDPPDSSLSTGITIVLHQARPITIRFWLATSIKKLIFYACANVLLYWYFAYVINLCKEIKKAEIEGKVYF
jgi:hypothetical protein